MLRSCIRCCADLALVSIGIGFSGIVLLEREEVCDTASVDEEVELLAFFLLLALPLAEEDEV